MTFKPLNRHALLHPIEKIEKENESTILVPDDYVKIKNPYEIYVVADVAHDCEKLRIGHIGDEVAVNNSMVEEIKVHGETYYLLLENYVYGVVRQEE